MSVVVQERRDPEDYAGEEENGESSSSGDVQFESDDRCKFCRYPLMTRRDPDDQSCAVRSWGWLWEERHMCWGPPGVLLDLLLRSKEQGRQ